MQKKNLVIVLLFIVLLGVFVYPKFSGKTAVVPIADVSANPSKYLGKLTMAGIAGTIYSEDGVFVLMDEKGCCQIPMYVPFTLEQRQSLNVTALYSGQLPGQGDLLEVTGMLKKDGTNYLFDVEKISRGDVIIISKR